MQKEIECPNCKGTGKTTIGQCDECGEKGDVGKYEGKEICQQCWMGKLTKEELENL